MRTKQLLLLLGVVSTANYAFAQAAQPRRIYLGDIKDKQGQVIYQVVNRFYTMRAARMQHGHSEILFLNLAGQPVASYAVSMPENLPVDLRSNILYFRYQRSGRSQSAQYQQLINPAVPLPAVLCVAPGDCFHRQ
ncbi:hypothetical protein [Hymenobacter arcticus]